MSFLRRLAATLAVAIGLVALVAPAASAHVLPSSSVALDVGEQSIVATASIPLDDLEAATGLDLGDESQEAVDAASEALAAYLLAHVAPTSDDGAAWTVTVGELTAQEVGDASTTGLYQQLTTTFTLTPPAGESTRSFDLGYSVVVDRVVTHVVLVTVASDWAGGTVDGAYELGTIRLDTVSGTVPSLHVDLGGGSEVRGFVSMVVLGVQHIQEGTDHQLFLLTLLLPAPLLARARRWAGPTTARRAVRRIAAITLAFTLGHSVTLALGALGLPVPSAPIEALIAVSILVAAVHAVRPIFPGREALVAAGFGLVHGLAFSATLRDLDLSGGRLVLALLGFNLGIEAMQLAIVALTLPPLLLLARVGRYRGLRVSAALLTAVAAAGWLIARLGVANGVADAADRIGAYSIPALVVLWAVSVAVTAAGRAGRETFYARSPADDAARPRRSCTSITEGTSRG